MTNSGDSEHTNLVPMNTDKGDRPPITQTPHSLPLNYTAWDQQELETLGKASITI